MAWFFNRVARFAWAPTTPEPRLGEMQGEAGTMIHSLCETCAWMREIVTPKGSRFLLCQLSKSDLAYPKYPPQPVVQCDGYQKKEQAEGIGER
jgi:hypothetical protein